MREMFMKHHGQEVEEPVYDKKGNRVRQLGPNIPQWIADAAKDIVLAELEMQLKSKTVPNYELCFKTVNSTMPVYKSKIVVSSYLMIFHPTPQRNYRF